MVKKVEQALVDLPSIPFISYVKSETGSGSRWHIQEQRTNENRVRHWALVWWEDRRGKHTAEAAIITESMPDFCGGLMVYSPIINVYDKSNSWSNCFCAPGDMEGKPEEQPSIKWDAFQNGTSAINLARFTGKDDWEAPTVIQYLRECLVKQMCGQALNDGKRGIVAADRIGGRLTEIMRTGARMYEVECNKMGFMYDPISNTSDSSGVLYGRGWRQVVNFSLEEGSEWRNVNSGNMVHWMSVSLSGDGDPPAHYDCWNCGHTLTDPGGEDCPNCDEWNSVSDDDYDDYLPTREYQMPKWVITQLCETDYHRRARRYFWRIG